VTLDLSEDAWEGDTQFVLYVDGKAVTSPEVVSALHDAHATQSFSFSGNGQLGTPTIGVALVNHASGESAGTERNLYIDGVTVNGSDVFSGTKELSSNGIDNFTVTTTK
jgi:hypothetical protein